MAHNFLPNTQANVLSDLMYFETIIVSCKISLTVDVHMLLELIEEQNEILFSFQCSKEIIDLMENNILILMAVNTLIVWTSEP